MRVNALFTALVAAVCLMATTPAAASQEETRVKSPALVKQLVSAMNARQLTAIAAVDPSEPGRFVGALAFPDVQLLVMSTQHKSAEWVQQQINKKLFREAYDALQLGIPEGRLFFHDIGCDGFSGTDEYIDIFYEGAKNRTMFDGNWMGQSMTEEQYIAKRKEAEEKYVHALTVLLDAVKKLPVITTP